MHLLRNAVDHGLEPPDERMARGKRPAGTIEIEVGVDHGELQITISDDGRGLALARIRERAAALGLVASDAQIDDEAAAELIFRPGFSTAQALTEVSGRGVGMDAVRGMLAKEHARIELRFTDEQRGAAYRSFQTIVHLPETWVVDSLAEPHGEVGSAGGAGAPRDALAS
jgi:chemotaxis protein histidine kinase CheA